MKSALTLLALSVVAPGPSTPSAPAQDPIAIPESEPFVSVEERQGVRWCTLRCELTPVQDVVERIAALIDVEVEGISPARRGLLVTADLRDRPLNQALEYALGSVGLKAELRRGVLRVLPDDLVGTTRDEALTVATASYLRASGAFPNHELVPRARLSQGALEEARNDLSAALSHYEYVLDNHAESDVAPLALLRSGLALEGLELYSDAQDQFLTLANLEQEHQWRNEAWLGLARTTGALGDYGRVLHVLDALEANFEPRDAQEQAERLYERAVALLETSQAMQCLRVLDDLEQLGMNEEQRVAGFALRARALEAEDFPDLAARSWLIHARETEDGEEASAALASAARLALAEQDYPTVLLVHEEAEMRGLGDHTRGMELEARTALGLVAAVDPEVATPLERLELAESWITDGRDAEVEELLEGLWQDRASLGEEGISRVFRLRGILLERGVGLARALEVLRAARLTLEQPENRARLDRLAGELLVKHERFDQAADAYGGRY